MKNKASVSMALIAIVISVISILLALVSIVFELVGVCFDIDVIHEWLSPFALWAYSVFIALGSLIFHVLYAVLSVIDIYLKTTPFWALLRF